MQNKNSNLNLIISFLIVTGLVVLGVYLLLKPNKAVIDSSDVNTQEIMSGDKINEQVKTEEKVEQNINKVTEVKTSTNKNMEKVAKNGDTLVMNYTGRLTDGTVFDSNVDPKFNHVTPFEFVLGSGMVIKGWDEGMVSMKIGEKKTLTIPYDKAYGERGYGPIPPKATLIFDVELVDIK